MTHNEMVFWSQGLLIGTALIALIIVYWTRKNRKP